MAEIILMSDPKVAAVPVRECGERLVDVRRDGRLPVDARKVDGGGAFARLREGVFERLLKAQELLPEGLRLLFVEGYRPPSLQRRDFEEYGAELSAAHPDWSAELVRSAASRYVSPPEIAPQQVHARLTRLNACLFSAEADEEKEAALLVFFGELFGEMHVRSTVREQPRDAERLRRVQANIAARCAESLSLDELAREAGMSRYHFVRAFSRVVGMTPHAWQLDQRIVRARGLLEQGM